MTTPIRWAIVAEFKTVTDATVKMQAIVPAHELKEAISDIHEASMEGHTIKMVPPDTKTP